MRCRDPYGYALSTGRGGGDGVRRGVWVTCSGCSAGAVESVARAIVHDPTFALGHAALALLGHELCAPVDIQARLRDAERARRGAARARERGHVHAVDLARARRLRPVARWWPTVASTRADAPAASTAAPTIAFAGSHGGPRGGVGDRRARDPGVRRRLVVHRPAGVRAIRSSAGSTRRWSSRRRHSTVEPGRPRGACPRARSLRDRRPRGGLAWMDAWVTGTGLDREPQPLLVARRTSCRSAMAAGRPARRRLRPETRRAAARGAAARAVPRRPRGTGVAACRRDVADRRRRPAGARRPSDVTLRLDDRAGCALPLGGRTASPSARSSPLARALCCCRRSDAATPGPARRTRLGGSDAQRELVEEPGSARSCGPAGTATPRGAGRRRPPSLPARPSLARACLEPAGGPSGPRDPVARDLMSIGSSPVAPAADVAGAIDWLPWDRLPCSTAPPLRADCVADRRGTPSSAGRSRSSTARIGRPDLVGRRQRGLRSLGSRWVADRWRLVGSATLGRCSATVDRAPRQRRREPAPPRARRGPGARCSVAASGSDRGSSGSTLVTVHSGGCRSRRRP